MPSPCKPTTYSMVAFMVKRKVPDTDCSIYTIVTESTSIEEDEGLQTQLLYGYSLNARCSARCEYSSRS